MENPENGNNLEIYHYLETQLQLFKGHFLITQASMDQEAIHQMRVAIKRIRTIQKLKKHINLPAILDDHQYESIKTIFADSGKLRDLQIQLSLLSDYRKSLNLSFSGFFDYLRQKETELTRNLNVTIKAIDFSRFMEIPEPGELPGIADENTHLETESLDFLQKKIEKINKLIFTLDRDEFVHDLRKQVKQLLFIVQFLKKHFPDHAVSHYKLKTLKDIGEKIGQWNDRDVFMEMLTAFIGEKQENFLLKNAGYKILQYVLEDEKKSFLSGVDTDIYLELAAIRIMLYGDQVEEQQNLSTSPEANI